MRKSKFSEEQIIAILAEQERGMATSEVCRRPGARNRSRSRLVQLRRLRSVSVQGAIWPWGNISPYNDIDCVLVRPYKLSIESSGMVV